MGKEYVVLIFGDLDIDELLLVWIYLECLIGDVLYSMCCDCGYQLEEVLWSIVWEGWGIFMYLCQEGWGIGLLNKICVYNFQDQGVDIVEVNEQFGFVVDLWDYSMCKDMFEYLGIRSLCLMINNLRKVKLLEFYGIDIVEWVLLYVGWNFYNEYYFDIK